MKQRLHIMRPKLFIAAAGLSILLALPVSLALRSRDTQLKSHQRANHALRLQIEKLHTKPVSKLTPQKQAVNPPVAISAPVTAPVATHTDPPAQPEATAQPTVTLASFTCQSYSNLFSQYSWNPDTAMAICQAESSGNPSAVSNGNINPDGVSDFGLMQLHGIDILDPAANIAYAYYHKYLTQGWGAWSTFNSGAYYKYL